jgi:hypothetical protein
MLSTVKIAQFAHVGAMKLLVAKTVVGAGMIAGTAATGLVAYTGLPPDYLNGVSELINNAVMAETSDAAPVALPDADTSSAPQVRDPDAGASASPSAVSVLRMDAAASDVPQVVITAHRMTRTEKLAYDSKHGAATLLAAISRQLPVDGP